MNSLICILGVFSLVLHDICLAEVFITYDNVHEIQAVYAGKKKEDHHLAHLATLTSEQRHETCNYYRKGEYEDNEESRVHMYEVEISDSVIPVEVSPDSGSPKKEKPESSKVAKDEELMEVEHPEEQLQIEKLKLKEPEGSKKEEESKVPPMIYDEEIGFRCQPKNREHKPFIISYGFAQETLFVSEPVGELDPNKKFNGRKMRLQGYMFAPPILEDLTEDGLQQKYFELRERTEKARDEAPALLEDIEKNDDISALTFAEKNIFCASIQDSEHYKQQGYQFVAAVNPEEYKYVKYDVGFSPPKPRTFPTDFMKCKAKKDDSLVIIGVTRSYAEGGDVYTSIIDENAPHQIIDVEVIRIPVLFNRKYAGDREGVLQMLATIRAT